MKGLRQRLVEQDILLGPPESAHTDTFSTHTHALSHRRAHTHTRKKVMLGLIVSLKPATLDCLKKKMGVERNFLQKHSRQTDPLEPFGDTVWTLVCEETLTGFLPGGTHLRTSWVMAYSFGGWVGSRWSLGFMIVRVSQSSCWSHLEVKLPWILSALQRGFLTVWWLGSRNKQERQDKSYLLLFFFLFF